MPCHVCGAMNRVGARFCNHCGAEFVVGGSQVLQSGQTMNNGQYRIVRRLETGGMGTIYLAANTQAFDRLCVIKEMLAYYKPGEETRARERFEEEAKTLAALRHPGVPDMYGFFSENGRNYIVMEYIEGENLAAGLTHSDDDSGRLIAGQPRDQEDVVRYGIQICRVLEYLADIQLTPVIHNDIKPANIIINKHAGQAVLVDFGTAKARYTGGGRPGTQKSSIYGTVGYAAPELYNGQSEPKSDVYALAATMYHLLTDDDPRDHPFKFPQLNQLPDDLHHILDKALASNAAERLTATELRQRLESYRAAHASSVHPLHFPQGDQATTITGLLDLSTRHWAYTRGILYDGSLENWLRTTLHDPVTANKVQEIVQRFPNNQDAGLDHFVRMFNPRIGAPRLRVITPDLDFGKLTAGDSTQQVLSLINTGGGGAHGEVWSSVPWLAPASTAFGCGPTDRCNIPIHVVDSGVLAAGRHMGKITLAPAGGAVIDIPATLWIRRSAATQPVQPTSVPVQRMGPRRRQRQHGWPWFANWWVWLFLFWLLSNMFGSCVARDFSFDASSDLQHEQESNPPRVVQIEPQSGLPLQPILERAPEIYRLIGTLVQEVNQIFNTLLESLEGAGGNAYSSPLRRQTPE